MTRLENVKDNWDDEFPKIIWAYKTTPHSSTRVSMFSMSYRTKVVALAEFGEKSLRVKQYTWVGNEQDFGFC